MPIENVLRTATVEATLSDIGDAIDTHGIYSWVSVSVASVGAALTDFALLVQPAPGGTWITRWSGADWATAANFRDGSWIGTSNTTSANIKILPDGEKCELLLWVGPVFAVKFQATDGAATAVVTIMGLISAGA